MGKKDKKAKRKTTTEAPQATTPLAQTASEQSLADMTHEALEAALDEGALHDKINKRVDELIDDAVENAFRWGKARDVLRRKIDETLVASIESTNIDNAKVEIFLDRLIEESAIAERRKLLEGARLLASSDGLSAQMPLSKLAKQYAKFVSERFENDGREIIDGKYAMLTVSMRVERTRPRMWDSVFEDVIVHFESITDDDPNDCNEELARDVTLTRYHRDDYWTVNGPVKDLSISDLRHLDAFSVTCARLAINHVDIELDCDMGDAEEIDVEPAQEPELSYS